jgi:hypothetical protein
MARVSSHNATHLNDSAGDDKKIALVKQIMSGYAQALKKLGLYLHQNDGLEDFFQVSLDGMKEFHQKYGQLTLIVKPFDFFFDGESVYFAENQENSPAYKLYSAGIRSLTFEKGVVGRDLVALGRLLLKTPIELRDDDMASLLWREGIPHIAYLQIHSTEDSTGEGGVSADEVEDTEALEKLYSYIQKQFSAKEPRNQVNFRSFSASDFDLDSFLGRTQTSRELFEAPQRMSPREVKYIREVLAEEEKQLTEQGSELLFFLCKHAEYPAELNDISETFTSICEHLFFSFEFTNLARLFDALETTARAATGRSGKVFLSLKKKLFGDFLEEERLQILLDFLQNAPPMRDEERNDIRLFLTLLGPELHPFLTEQLPHVTSVARRLFLSVLLHAANNPHAASLTLLEQFEQNKDILVDMLHVGREVLHTFSRTQLEGFLGHTDSQVQRLALAVFIEQYPGEIADMSGGFFKNASSDVIRALFEVLCQNDEGDGLETLFQFVKSKRFKKLEQEDQKALFNILGHSQRPDFLAWFDEVLGRKSRFFLPAVDREKQLAIKAMESFGTFEALNLLKKHVDTGMHSPAIQNEIAHAVTFYHLYLKASSAPPPPPKEEWGEKAY